MPKAKPKAKRPKPTIGEPVEPKSRPRGNQAYVPNEFDLGAIQSLAAFGHKDRTIAAFLGLGVDTLYKYYPKEMATAKLKLDAAAITGLAKGLAAGEQWAVLHVLRTRGRKYGWADRSQPILDLSEVLGNADLGKLSNQKLRQLVDLLAMAGVNVPEPAAADMLTIGNGSTAD